MSQGDLFSRPVRKVKRTVRKVKRVKRRVKRFSPRTCPKCRNESTLIVSVLGTIDPPQLVTKRRCPKCDHKWASNEERKDICEHGKSLQVPCARCERDWEEIEGG